MVIGPCCILFSMVEIEPHNPNRVSVVDWYQVLVLVLEALKGFYTSTRFRLPKHLSCLSVGPLTVATMSHNAAMRESRKLRRAGQVSMDHPGAPSGSGGSSYQPRAPETHDDDDGNGAYDPHRTQDRERQHFIQRTDCCERGS